MKIIFIGTSKFAAVILERLAGSTNKPFLVITALEKPAGRKKNLTPPPVKVSAENYGIPVVQPKAIGNFTDEIKKLNPDIIILAAYGQIIPKEILFIPKYGCLNIHPSLLPRWRGASPIQQAILNNDEKTGVSIIKMTSQLDAGPIFYQKEMIIDQEDTFVTLRDKLAKMAGEMIAKILVKIFSSKITPLLQDESKANYAKTLKKEEGKIDWQKPADFLARQVRAFYPWPGSFAFFKYKGKPVKVKIIKARKLEPEEEKEGLLAVKCGQDFLLIEKLQIEGGKELDWQDFYRGHADFLTARPV